MGFISGEHSPRSSWFPVASDALDNPSVVSVEISTISTGEAGQIRMQPRIDCRIVRAIAERF